MCRAAARGGVEPGPCSEGRAASGFAQDLHLWLGARESDGCPIRCSEDVGEKRKVVERLTCKEETAHPQNSSMFWPLDFRRTLFNVPPCFFFVSHTWLRTYMAFVL